jgi:2-polyprenyl-3-methyl-5-hydroxy-6-metoxy-1,4-benzoquinol methylase
MEPVLADHELNRASWDQLAAIHGQDAYYDAQALCGGASSLVPEEEAALTLAFGADVAGKRILHLQCHLGFDAITFARRGADVTGVDFSTVALEKARALAARCNVQVDWVCSDVLELPEDLNSSFDVAWATLGVVCWIGDLSAWMRAVSAVLAPGGKLVLIDGVASEPASQLAGDLAEPTPLRRVVQCGWDYATTLRTGPQVQFHYPLRAIVSAARRAGLRIRHLEEHTSISTHLCINGLVRESDGRYRKPGAAPVLFTLIAERDELSASVPAGTAAPNER